MTDAEFLAAFETQNLALACWNHQAHVRLGWLLLQKHGDFSCALEETSRLIDSYNQKVGAKVGYHQTMTEAYLRLIDHHQKVNRSANWQALENKAPQLFAPALALLKKYYSPHILNSQTAKTSFVAPDLRPLPAIGKLRAAGADDAADILKIYGPYVEHTAISFETQVPSMEEMRQRIQEYSKYCFLLCQVDQQVAGLAYASPFRSRKAYEWSVEVTIYVGPNFQRQGIGELLYGELFARLKEKNFVNVYAGIALPNAPSVALHERMGLTHLGVFHKAGFKHGKWHDVGWWQMALNPASKAPQALVWN